MNITILRYDELLSTNTEAANQVRKGASEGLCIVAAGQSAGRGREGRKWVSPSGSGLYFSIVLRPVFGPRYFPVLPLMGAVAVYETLAQVCSVTPDIKWPNDILIDEKKISGILTETCETKSGLAVIMGIGINLNSDGLNESLRTSATSIRDVTGSVADYESLLQSLTKNISSQYDPIKKDSDIAVVLDAWSSRSSYFSGKEVRVTTRKQTLTGTTVGLDPLGSLLVESDHGGVTTVTAGDVESVRSNKNTE